VETRRADGDRFYLSNLYSSQKFAKKNIRERPPRCHKHKQVRWLPVGKKKHKKIREKATRLS
jgi:hypothetical protein